MADTRSRLESLWLLRLIVLLHLPTQAYGCGLMWRYYVFLFKRLLWLSTFRIRLCPSLSLSLSLLKAVSFLKVNHIHSLVMEGTRMANLIRDMKDEVWAQRRTPYGVPSGSKRRTAPGRGQPSYQPCSTPDYQYTPISFASPYTDASGTSIAFPKPQLSVPNFPLRQGSSVMTQPGSSTRSPLYVPLDLGNQTTIGSSPPRFPIPELDVPVDLLPLQPSSVRYENVSPFISPQYSNYTSCESSHPSWSYSASSTSSVCLSVYGTLLSRAIDEIRQCNSIFSAWKFALRR